jgi:hypothetical protein
MQDDQIIQLEDVQSMAPQSAPQQQQDIPLPEEPVAQAQPQQQAPVETEQARNFRQLKDSKDREERDRKRAERERDEAIAYIKEMRSKQYQQQQAPAAVEEDELSINSDDFVEGKTVKKVYNEVRELKKQLKQYQQQSASSLAETRLKAMHPDADAVLSKDNIAEFSQKYPEMANTIFHSSGDDYSKMLSAYTMIKQLGVHQDYRQDLYSADRDLAQRNAAKPRPLTSIAPQQGDSPMSRANAFANGLTPELQKQLRKEMEEARKGSM